MNKSRRQFYLPGTDDDIEYVGLERWPVSGDLSFWRLALEHLVFMQAYIALTVLALSSVSPLVRLLAEAKNRRRPVIGLVATSSTGKGTLINAALALWALLSTLTLPASSTTKGLQDAGIEAPDLPLFADELQQVYKSPGGSSSVEAIMFFLGNGQRRKTSSQEQVAKGGELRFGVGFYASELPIMPNLQTGAQYRAIEFQGPPLPDAETASLLAEATQHVGVVGRALTRLINAEQDDLVARTERRLDALQAAHEHLKGDDAFTLALVDTGLNLLARVCETTMPTDEVMAFLIGVVGQQRQATVSPEEAALSELVQKVLGAEWSSDILLRGGERVALRRPDHLDVNPGSDMVKAALREWPNYRAFVKRWAERDWIDCNTDRHTWNRRVGTDTMRMWRINARGLRQAGVEAINSDLPETR